MSNSDVNKISKFLSLVLRHQPEAAGVKLDDNGWVEVEQLLSNMRERGWKMDFELLSLVVDTNNKKRFAFNEDKSKIRASQGHSIDIELGYSPQLPPPILYHGTAEKNLASILKDGLQKRSRQHVHLSQEIETAIKVGARHGKPVVLQVEAEGMYKEGFAFFISENGVWLTDHVPATAISVL